MRAGTLHSANTHTVPTNYMPAGNNACGKMLPADTILAGNILPAGKKLPADNMLNRLFHAYGRPLPNPNFSSYDQKYNISVSYIVCQVLHQEKLSFPN